MWRKLLVFDCDGVLTYEKSSWRVLHEYFGSRDNSYFANLYKQGVISYLDWMKIDVALMIHSYGKPIKKEDVEKALSKIKPRPQARRVIREIINRGHLVAVVSSGVDLVVKRICTELGIELCLYNELVFHGEELIPGGAVRVPLKEKSHIVKRLAEETGIGLNNTIYVGDDEWDVEVFKTVPTSIAIEPCGEACNYAKHVIRDLEDILVLGIV